MSQEWRGGIKDEQRQIQKTEMGIAGSTGDDIIFA